MKFKKAVRFAFSSNTIRILGRFKYIVFLIVLVAYLRYFMAFQKQAKTNETFCLFFKCHVIWHEGKTM